MGENNNNGQNQAEGKAVEIKGTDMKWRMSGFLPWIEGKAGRPLKLIDKILGVVIILAFLFLFYVVLDANKYRMQVAIIEGERRVGVNPTAELLDFGDMSKGTTAVRTMTLQNGTFMPVYVMIWKTGSLAELVDITRREGGVEQNYFKLSPHTETKIDFTASMPASVQAGQGFSGRVYIFKVPTFGF